MNRATRVVVVMAIAAILGACGPEAASPGATGAPVSPGATSPTPTSEPTIAIAPVEATEIEFSLAEDTRTVRLFVPELEPGDNAALLVLLHGWREFPSTMEMRVQPGVLAARDKVMVAIPPGRDGNWDAVFQPAEAGEASPDVAYVSGLIDRLVDQYAADPDRVYVGGFSMGAVLTDRIGCQVADRVRAIVVVGGSPWHSECDPARPVSALIIHGVSDQTMPVEEAATLAERWRAVDHCSGEPAQTAVGANALALTSPDCADGSRVEFVTVEGQGHVWFRTPDATQLALDFLRSIGGL
jgi:polyhydroxybutyrate depolymerase